MAIGLTSDLSKEELRKVIRKVLATITDKRPRSSAIQEQIIKSKQYQESQKVLLYYSLGNEVYTHELIRRSLDLNKEVYLPYSKKLQIGQITSLHNLIQDNFGIMVPTEPTEIEVDYALVPGLAFDKDMNRLGKGSGWYDRFLAMHPNIFTQGVCFKEQIVEVVPVEEHDLNVENVIYS